MSFEEQIERWDRTATASPGSFAAALKAYWVGLEQKKASKSNKEKMLEELHALIKEAAKEWPASCDHGVLMVNERGQCNAADANKRFCKNGGDGIKEQPATEQNPFYKDEK